MIDAVLFDPQLLIAPVIVAAGISAAGSLGSAALSRSGGGGSFGPSSFTFARIKKAEEARDAFYGDSMRSIERAQHVLSRGERRKGEIFSLLGTGLGPESFSQNRGGRYINPNRGRRGRPMSPRVSEALFSPSGRIMDRLVQTGRDYLDPSSETYQQHYEALTEPALTALEARVTQGERSIAADRRSAERSIRDVGLRRGAARNPYGERAMMQRSAEESALMRANLRLEAGVEESRILADANRYMIEYGQRFASNAVQAAHDFANNSFGQRDAFLTAMANTHLAAAEIAGSLARQESANVGGLSGAAVSATERGRSSAMLQSQEIRADVAGVVSGTLSRGLFAWATQPPQPEARDPYAGQASADEVIARMRAREAAGGFGEPGVNF